jgi:hypothetical protein
MITSKDARKIQKLTAKGEEREREREREVTAICHWCNSRKLQ